MKKLTFVFIVGLAALVVSCAKQGYPSGGPRDITPPAVTAMQPEAGTTHFANRSFSITFDEYVVLNDPDNNIIISPPIQPKPQYTLKGKSLVVDLPDTLRPDVTYLFQMHGAIADFTEGNRIGPLEYAFSTGSVIDSLSLQGFVLDAYKGMPTDKTVTVLLYRQSGDAEWDDSTVTRKQPDYVARCDEKGHFRFNFMADGQYRMIAIDDADRNLRYNGDEAVAFLDTLFRPTWLPQPDDSSATPEKHDSELTLLLSKDSTHAAQRITKSEFLSPSRVVVTTAAPMLQPRLRCADSLTWKCNDRGDTLQVWLRQPKRDTVTLMLSDASGIDDTLQLKWRRKGPQRRRKDGTAVADTAVLLQARFLFASSVGVFDSLSLSFSNPVAHCADTALQMLNLTDSVYSTVRLRFDSLSLSARIDTVLPGGNKYVFTLAAGAVTDLWDNLNGRIESTVEVLSSDRYGNIFLTCRDVLPSSIILQLTDEQGTVVRSLPWPAGQQRLGLEHLKPGKYRIQAFDDKNGDGRWTAGNYWQHRQPEPVYRFEKTLDVRENWDIEESWQMLR